MLSAGAGQDRKSGENAVGRSKRGINSSRTPRDVCAGLVIKKDGSTSAKLILVNAYCIVA